MLINGGAFTQPCGISTPFCGEDSIGNSYENWMSVRSYIMILYHMKCWHWKSILVNFLFRRLEMHVFSAGTCYDCISWSSGYFARCLIQYEGRSISKIMVLLIDITLFAIIIFMKSILCSLSNHLTRKPPLWSWKRRLYQVFIDYHLIQPCGFGTWAP